MKQIDVIAAVLLVIGGLNWGLVGLFDTNAVATLLGADSTGASIVYLLVGLSGIWQALQWKGIQRRWLNSAQAQVSPNAS